MSVIRVDQPPAELADLPNHQRYHWYELCDDSGPFAKAATARSGDDMELHLVATRWGPKVQREMTKDMDWLKDQAREQGMRRIIGMKLETGATPDPRWPKFTRLFGFQGHCLIQSASVVL